MKTVNFIFDCDTFKDDVKAVKADYNKESGVIIELDVNGSLNYENVKFIHDTISKCSRGYELEIKADNNKLKTVISLLW